VSIRHEKRRLGRAFQAALLAVGSPAIVFACSGSKGVTRATPDDGGAATSVDATQTGDTSAPDAVVFDGSGEASDDAGPDDVAMVPPPADAGPPPPPTCSADSYPTDAGPVASDADVCAYVYPCGLGGTLLTPSGCQVLDELADGALVPLPQTTCWFPQGGGCDNDAYAPGEGGAVTIICSPCPGGAGRRPVGLSKPRGTREASGGTLLGAYLASMAFEEDAAVTAFDRMRAELAALGAPPALVSAAARATRDEVRHAATMAKLATAGCREGVVTRPRIRPARRRSAAAVAAENAAEGCVRETYGALVARWQSVHAGDVTLRSAFSRIAADEARHAALSWAVARWIEPRLDAAGRKRVVRARARALRALRRTVGVEPPSALVREAGVPAASQACALLEAMSRELSLA
jgi:hypothetical protein